MRRRSDGLSCVKTAISTWSQGFALLWRLTYVVVARARRHWGLGEWVAVALCAILLYALVTASGRATPDPSGSGDRTPPAAERPGAEVVAPELPGEPKR